MATQARQLPDWEVGPVRYSWSKRLKLFTGLIGPWVLLGVLVQLPGGFSRAGLVLTVAIFVIVNALLWFNIERQMLAHVASEPLDEPRFTNIVQGLADRYRVPMPRLAVTDKGGPNAFVRSRGPSIVVSRALLDTYTRTEQEAVAAHCLVRLNSGHLRFAHLAAMLGRMGSRFAPKVGYEDDIHAVALTRYPPALASAIQKAKPVEDVSGVMWFVAHGTSHRPPPERIAALQDL
jgi:Zn-dependent protease with chaperone function